MTGVQTCALPIWSSTNQAPGDKSDCVLRPVFSCPDPIRGGDNILVMAEVLYIDMTPHETNTRATCAAMAEQIMNTEMRMPVMRIPARRAASRLPPTA